MGNDTTEGKVVVGGFTSSSLSLIIHDIRIPMIELQPAAGAWTVRQIDASILERILPYVLLVLWIYVAVKKNLGDRESRERIPSPVHTAFLPGCCCRHNCKTVTKPVVLNDFEAPPIIYYY
ncbi:MAG: hypothetical protein DRP70_11065 [Spirochaetes bacterium]|nr:MAG: hypothetical protein DRP70_11065 [Spirochaetota bacterium]RKX93088.1 MAG: hypothetical protein DRZ90_13175 [Spirochaetota bacterium]